MSAAYARKRSLLLGENVGTASHKLRKSIMFAAIAALGTDVCYRCGKKITHIDQLSIEHKQAWQSAPDPKEAFFDLNNIAFSHLSCNIKAGTGGKRTKKADNAPCIYGHTDVTRSSSGTRQCRECKRQHQKQYQLTPQGKVRRRHYARDYMRKYRAAQAAASELHA